MEIRCEDLTTEHLRKFDRIEAIKYNSENMAVDRVRVWSSKLLPPFQGKNVEAPETKTLFVRVTTENSEMEFLEKKINQLSHS